MIHNDSDPSTFMSLHDDDQVNTEFLRTYFHSSADVIIHEFNATGSQDNNKYITLIYCPGMTDVKQINELALPRFEALYQDFPDPSASDISMNRHLPLTPIRGDGILHEISYYVYSGSLVIYFTDLDLFFRLDIASPPTRAPGEPLTESSIKGPRDGFTEDLTANLALLRKRLRSRSLCVESFVKGKRGETSIALIYIDDIINSDILDEVRQRLNQINIDAITGTSFIESIITGSNNRSLFPLTDYSGRPDFIADSLLTGKFAVLVDGSPMGIIAPITLTNLLTSPEDANTQYYNVVIQKLLRLFGLFIALFLPGFYIALTSFNLEQIPLPLLATISNSRQGLPLPIPLETFMMLFLFEIFNEAGRRLPKALGQTVTVVGGLIIGDAAIRSGITSPTIIVTVAITIVAASTLINQTLSGATSQIRIIILLMSSLLGMFGFIISAIAIVFYLASLENYGVPYLSPLSPFHKRDFLLSLFRKPEEKQILRPGALHTNDNTRGGDNP